MVTMTPLIFTTYRHFYDVADDAVEDFHFYAWVSHLHHRGDYRYTQRLNYLATLAKRWLVVSRSYRFRFL